MSDLSKGARSALSERYEVGGYRFLEEKISLDGTRKYLFPSQRATPIETVVIPDEDRATLCVSSQIGCLMGCRFCMTARMGFKGDLSSGEIISQFINVTHHDSLTNIVYMGMGEPLDNYNEVIRSMEILTSDWGFGMSPKRITLSTIGILSPLKNYLDNSKCHLAISLHNPFDKERIELMPVQRVHPLSSVVELVRRYDFTGQRRISFEYIMFSGWNDTKRHADALIRMLSGLECRINLICFHQITDTPLKPTPFKVMENFRDRLNKAGVLTTIRASRGEDVHAVSGMLSSSRQS